MKNGAKTFGKVYLEVDKMAGLRLALRDKKHAGTILQVRDWDQIATPEVKGTLYDDEKEVWEGILFTIQQIQNLFQPFELYDTTHPIPYAQRSGRLGHPKTVGVLRVETRNAIDFQLTLCDGGEAQLKTLAEITHPHRLVLTMQIRENSMSQALFERAGEEAKLAKIRERE